MLRCPKCGYYLPVCICGRRAVLVGVPVVLVTVLARKVGAQGTTGSAGASANPSGTTQQFGTDGRPPAGKQSLL